MRNKGILAMEDNEDVIVADAPEVTEVELTAEAPEAEAMAEVAEAEDAVVESDEAVEEAAETVGELEEVRDAVEDSVETEGGLAEPEARALDVAVESMLVRLGASRTKAKVFPAMEGFKEKSTRVASTKIALESMSEQIKKIWAAIVANIQKAFEFVMAFVKAIANGTKFLEVRANSVKKAAAAKKGAAAAESVNAKRFGGKLLAGGKIASGADLVHGIDKLYNDPKINKDYGALATKCNATVVKILDAVGKEDGASIAATASEELIKDLELEGAIGKAEAYDLPLGDAQFVVTASVNEGKQLTKATAEIVAGKATAPETAAGMSPEDAGKVADAVLKNLAKFAKYEKQSGDIAALMKSVTTKMSSAMSKAKDDQAVNNEIVRTLARSINVVKSVLVRSSTVLRSYDLHTTKAALDYAAASVAGAGKVKEAAKTAAAAA